MEIRLHKATGVREKRVGFYLVEVDSFYLGSTREGLQCNELLICNEYPSFFQPATLNAIFLSFYYKNIATGDG